MVWWKKWLIENVLSGVVVLLVVMRLVSMLLMFGVSRKLFLEKLNVCSRFGVVWFMLMIGLWLGV